MPRRIGETWNFLHLTKILELREENGDRDPSKLPCLVPTFSMGLQASQLFHVLFLLPGVTFPVTCLTSTCRATAHPDPDQPKLDSLFGAPWPLHSADQSLAGSLA